MGEIAELVGAAGSGDERAWEALTERFTGLLWHVVRGYRLPRSDATDVIQATWLRFVEHLDGIRDPDRAGAWLVTTARREALGVLRKGSREVVSEHEAIDYVQSRDVPTFSQQYVDGAAASERDQLVWQAIGSLSEQCQRLLRVLCADPPPSYRQVSAALDMPIGSIGPTRKRCLERLRTVIERAGISEQLRDSL